MMTPKQIMAMLKDDVAVRRRVRANPTNRKQWIVTAAGTKHRRAFMSEGQATAHAIEMKAHKYHLRVVWITSPAGKARKVESASVYHDHVRAKTRARKPYQVESRIGMKRFADHGLAAAYMLKLKSREIAYRASGPNGPMAMYSPGKKPISDAEIRRKYERGVLDMKRKGKLNAFSVVTSALYGAYGTDRVKRALAPLRVKAARKAARTRRSRARLNPVITFDLTPDEAKSWKTDIGRKVLIGRANSVYVASGSAPVVVAFRNNILATRTDSGWVFT